MLEQDRRFAPEVLVSTKNGGRVLAHHDHFFHNSHLGLNVPEESRDLTDFSSRVAHIDASGIVTFRCGSVLVNARRETRIGPDLKT
jgi:hypothetical protein